MLRTISFIVAFVFVLLSVVSITKAQIQGDQLSLFALNVMFDPSSASARTSHNDSALPSNWISPLDWTTGPVYWKVRVLSKISSQQFKLELHMEREHPNGDPGAEEIAEAATPVYVSNLGDTAYVKLNPLSQWSLFSTWIPSWEWTKPINGIYVTLYAWDDSKNAWVWFADSSVCGSNDFCYKGSLKQVDHLPMWIETQTIVVKAGAMFQPPIGWAGCPWPGCENLPTQHPLPTITPTLSAQPTTDPSNIPTILPTSNQGQCINKSIGDANCDDSVGLVDYEFWRREYKGGSTLMADFNGDGKVTLLDYETWRRGYMARAH